MIKSFIRKATFLFSGGAIYKDQFKVNKALLNLFGSSSWQLLPLALAFSYFGFMKAALSIILFFMIWFGAVFWSTSSK